MKHQYVRDLAREFSGYGHTRFVADLLAGVTVAAVALPLALAFGVGSGSDAASGLVTAITAGLFIATFGGSSFQISGPTGAMAAILLPLSSRFGIEGVLAAGFLSGIILVIAAIGKAGRIVSIIPLPVITGFTSGIAILIALGQIDNLLGISNPADTLPMKLLGYIQRPAVSWQPLVLGVGVMLTMAFWPRKWNARIPSSLVGLVLATLVNMAMGFHVEEVGTIPRTLVLENRLHLGFFNMELLGELLVPAASIAALGMIESLLCGAAGGKMKGERLQADRELLAQGLGNMLIPLLGGVPATAAIARTSVAIKSGGATRVTSIIHSVTLVASMFILGPFMSRIPLSALAGILIMTAWRMNEWEHITEYFHGRYKTSMAQFLVTMGATVMFDLTMAILLGIGLSMVIFVITSSNLDISVANIDERHEKGRNLCEHLTKVKLMYVTGQLFFGSQDKLVASIENLGSVSTVILSIRGVPSIDHSAMSALHEIHDLLVAREARLVFCGLQPRVHRQFERSGFDKKIGKGNIFNNAVEAIDSLDFLH